jgi:superfamily II DNA/RNA helicase
MLDMGFIPDIEEICTKLPKQRQTLLFSATMPPPIKKLADKFLDNPKTIEVSRPASTNLNITQRVVHVSGAKKRDVLRRLLLTEAVRTAIVFSNRKTTVRELNKTLQRAGFRSAEIHGDMDQSARIAELDRFKNGDVNILVASDVAARGLDVKGVSHVFNYDAPWHPDDYVHRIGRTGRGGATGIAYTFVTPEDAENIANIEKLTGQKIEVLDVDALPAGEAEAATEERAPRPERSRERRGREERAPRAEQPRRSREERAPRAEEVRPAEEPHRSRQERGLRAEEPRRHRHSEDLVPDDGGWNGPIPAFLDVRLTA